VVRVIVESDNVYKVKVSNTKTIQTDKKILVRYGKYKEKIMIESVSDTKSNENEIDKYFEDHQKFSSGIRRDEYDRVMQNLSDLKK